jgi:hypothetical protein
LDWRNSPEHLEAKRLRDEERARNAPAVKLESQKRRNKRARSVSKEKRSSSESRTEMTQPRLMSGADAAAYCGVTMGPQGDRFSAGQTFRHLVATFSKWVADGRALKPLPGTRQQEDAWDKWERKYDARKASRLR